MRIRIYNGNPPDEGEQSNEAEQRKKKLSQFLDRDAALFSIQGKAVGPEQEFIEKIKRLKCPSENTLLLIHLSPVKKHVVLEDLFSTWGDLPKKWFIVLFSGGGLQGDLLKDIKKGIAAAKEKGFGGVTYTTEPFHSIDWGHVRSKLDNFEEWLESSNAPNNEERFSHFSDVFSGQASSLQFNQMNDFVIKNQNSLRLHPSAKIFVLGINQEAVSNIRQILEQIKCSPFVKNSIVEFVWQNGKYELECFRTIANQLELLTGDVYAFVEGTDLSRLNPIAEDSWGSVIAMLILSFPKISWVFDTPRRTDSNEVKKIACEYCFLSLFRPHSSQLFDGYGLRRHVYTLAIKDKESNGVASYLVNRKRLAVTIDDEKSFAHFHSYAAYRFGFRAHAVTKESAADTLLHKITLKVHLTIEDLYLNFPDHEKHRLDYSDSSGFHDDVQLSELEQRNKALPLLNTATHRILVTSGQQQSGPKGLAKLMRNRNEFLGTRESHKLRKTCYKPTGGIFGLWIESGLMWKLRGEKGKYRTKGYAPGFVWPPETTNLSHENHGHSAPGRLLEISNRLQARAIKILNNSTSVDESVHAAVLATDALELLGERTPTSSLEALSLKHRAEVTAECQFLGTQYNLCIKPRLEELHREVQHIGKWFNPKTRTHATNNAELCIITELAKIFRDNAQFDEEQQCLNRVRDLHRKLWFNNHPYFNYLVIPRVTQWYIDFLLKSLGHFVLAVTIWIIALTLLFWCCSSEVVQGIQYAITSFFRGTAFSTGGNMDIKHGWHFTIALVSAVVGMFHFGVFINHLFSISNRR